MIHVLNVEWIDVAKYNTERIKKLFIALLYKVTRTMLKKYENSILIALPTVASNKDFSEKSTNLQYNINPAI